MLVLLLRYHCSSLCCRLQSRDNVVLELYGVVQLQYSHTVTLSDTYLMMSYL